MIAVKKKVAGYRAEFWRGTVCNALLFSGLNLCILVEIRLSRKPDVSTYNIEQEAYFRRLYAFPIISVCGPVCL